MTQVRKIVQPCARTPSHQTPSLWNDDPVDGLRLTAARDLAAIAGGLLQASDAALLAIAIPSDGWNARAPVVIWDHHLRPRADHSRMLWETALFAPVMDALCIAADALFDDMVAAGLCHHASVGPCIVTDGIGVALSASPPSPQDDGGRWLLDLAGGTPVDDRTGCGAARAPAGGAPILPLAATGPWALLSANGSGASCH